MQHLCAQFLVRHFAAAEAQRNLYLVACFEKPLQITEFDQVIALVCPWSEFDFLNLDLLLLTLGGMAFLAQIEQKLAKVHHPADRRLGSGHDLDQIEFVGLCFKPRSFDCNDSEVLSVRAYEAYLRTAYIPVDPVLLVGGYTSILQNALAALRNFLAEPIDEMYY